MRKNKQPEVLVWQRGERPRQMNHSDRGYFSLIVSDACAAATDNDHAPALARFDRLIGPVVDTNTIVGFLK